MNNAHIERIMEMLKGGRVEKKKKKRLLDVPMFRDGEVNEGHGVRCTCEACFPKRRAAGR